MFLRTDGCTLSLDRVTVSHCERLVRAHVQHVFLHIPPIITRQLTFIVTSTVAEVDTRCHCDQEESVRSTTNLKTTTLDSRMLCYAASVRRYRIALH